jgi:hypothetical protein
MKTLTVYKGNIKTTYVFSVTSRLDTFFISSDVFVLENDVAKEILTPHKFKTYLLNHPHYFNLLS